MSSAARWTAFWVVVVGCLGFVAFVATHGVKPPPAADGVLYSAPATTAASPTPTVDPTVALFVGDAYTVGSGTGSKPNSFASRACTTLKWTCYYDAQASSGYVTAGVQSNGTQSKTYGDRLKADKKYTPDVVVVSGGRADSGKAGVQAAATDYLEAVTKQFSDAKLVVLEPFWNNATPTQQIVAVRTAVQKAADAAGATYVSTTDWLTDAQIGPDGVLPTTSGHKALAKKLVAALRAEGLDA
ncbi:SGNH/GDSL hydrolase family protein [Spongisporangium articulatum]|uniref:SGNH/GDSL hydrolase family protein n=1 Tax=Spongisporangium articulatum TaxID=3362603 RepID=A0ABW8AU51_9ACTN